MRLVPERINTDWIGTLTDDDLIDVEARLHTKFALLERREKNEDGRIVSIVLQLARDDGGVGPVESVLTATRGAFAQSPAGEMTHIATEPISESRAKTEWRAVVARYQGSDVSRSIVQMITTLLPARRDMLYADVSVARPALLDNAPARIPHGGTARPHVHHHARLRPRLVLPSRRAERGRRIDHGRAHADRVQRQASLARVASCVLRRSRSSRTRRRRHDHRERVPRAQSQARFKYRLFRNPFVLFGIGPLFFMIDNRIPRRCRSRTKRSEAFGGRISRLSSAAAAADRLDRVARGAAHLLPAMYIAAAAGIWLFYVQHQFEDAYWKDHGEWDYATSAIRGSSYFKLPAVLQWFTGSIGSAPRASPWSAHSELQARAVPHREPAVPRSDGVDATAELRRRCDLRCGMRIPSASSATPIFAVSRKREPSPAKM